MYLLNQMYLHVFTCIFCIFCIFYVFTKLNLLYHASCNSVNKIRMQGNRSRHKRTGASGELNFHQRFSFDSPPRSRHLHSSEEKPLSPAMRGSLPYYHRKLNLMPIRCGSPQRPKSNLHEHQSKLTGLNLRATLSNLQEKISVAKLAFSQKKKVLSRYIINEQNCEFEEDRSVLQLNSLIQSDIQQKNMNSTINLSHQKKQSAYLQERGRPTSSFKRIKPYYVSELIKGFQGGNPSALQHLNITLKILKSSHKIKLPSLPQIHTKMQYLKRHPLDQHKKTLIIDIDETILHCDDLPSHHQDIVVDLSSIGLQNAKGYISLRPYALTFLKRVSKFYEIVAFTASEKSYADLVLDEIDPDRQIIRHRLYRQHCFQIRKNIYAKDLRIINRELKDVVLVDNAPFSYLFQLQNGIPILPYHKGYDEQLPALQRYLEQLSKAEDVRQLNKKTFRLHQYSTFIDAQELVKGLYL